ncbi:MAG: helix-turn-helix domain-containing protein [Phycisphaerae bacterium]|nr:helix-turn-helix domain-containing protein [Phycisphaerae bacterium]
MSAEREARPDARTSKRRVPRAVLDAVLSRHSIGPDAKLLYLALYRLVDTRRYRRRTQTWPTQAELADALGVHERHIRRDVAELRREGLLDSHKGYHTKPNVYRVVNPEEWPAATQTQTADVESLGVVVDTSHPQNGVVFRHESASEPLPDSDALSRQLRASAEAPREADASQVAASPAVCDSDFSTCRTRHGNLTVHGWPVTAYE